MGIWHNIKKKTFMFIKVAPVALYIYSYIDTIHVAADQVSYCSSHGVTPIRGLIIII